MGLDLGLEATGRFNLLACVEKEPSFCATIRENVRAGRVPGNPIVLERDISQLTVEDFLAATGINPDQVDVLIGGPPCQAFSTAGRRQSVQDPRGTLLWDFLRFVEKLQPKFFLMENVRGLLSAALKHREISSRPEKGGAPLSEMEEPGSVVRLFADDLQHIPGAAYHMDCFEVNAVNYGAPQLRERVLFIGNRHNVQVDFPAPTHGRNETEAETGDLFGAQALLPWRSLRDAIGELNDPGQITMDFSPRKKAFLAMVPPGSNWRSLPVDTQKESMGKAWFAKGGRSGWWRRLSYDLPCPTLVTMPNHASTALCHPEHVRALTLKEYARIQEFPDEWVFCGSPSQQFAQIGNAVPTRLGKIAGEVISVALDKLQSRNISDEIERPLDSYRVIYVQSHVRTRQWFKNGSTLVWEDGAVNTDAKYGAPVTKRREKRLLEQ